MKRLIRFALSLSPLLTVTACGNSNNPKILKNGDLLAISEITYENAFRDVNATQMDEMIKSNEPFIFYLTSSECHACYEFQEKILNYVTSTKNLVLRMDLYENREEFEQFAEQYHDYFFVENQIYTPQVYIAGGLNVATKVPFSRYSTSTMFKGAMKDYVNESNVYSFSSLSAYKKFVDSKDEYLAIFIDRNIDTVMNLYNNEISAVIKSSKKDVALFEITNEADFAFEGFYAPIGFYHSKDEEIQYMFTPNSPDNKAFLDKYC